MSNLPAGVTDDDIDALSDDRCVRCLSNEIFSNRGFHTGLCDNCLIDVDDHYSSSYEKIYDDEA